ncbi:MAG: tRNA (guanosine(37)-N1)-methyltransferase TrmD [Spirochaetia bacterium]
MQFTTFSLFPQILDQYCQSSIMGRAIKKGVLSCNHINFRDFATDRHKTCDDSPYGGGAGVVIKAEPLAAAIEAHKKEGWHIVFPSPSGKLFTQQTAKRLATHPHIAFIAGRYEGIDQRIIDLYVDEEISIGDYVLSSGELGCLVIMDAVMRLLDGAISPESLEEESFENGLLEYPHYTKPEIFANLRVPEVLLSGHHKKIKEWRDAKRLEKTLANRREIMQNSKLDL